MPWRDDGALLVYTSLFVAMLFTRSFGHLSGTFTRGRIVMHVQRVINHCCHALSQRESVRRGSPVYTLKKIDDAVIMSIDIHRVGDTMPIK